MRYRYYFFDSQAQLSAHEEHQSDSDALAIDYARETRDVRGFRGGFEVWNGFRLVHSEMRNKPTEQEALPKRNQSVMRL